MKLRAATALVALTAAVAGVAASPEVASVDVTVDGSTVAVTGELGAPIGATTIAVDAAGDALVNDLGHDLLGGTVSFPAPGRVAYSLEIAPNPATGHAPYGAQYATSLTVGTDTYELIANALPTGLTFASQTCVEGAASQECTTSPVDGSYADGKLTWELSAPALGGSNVSVAEVHVAVQANALVTLTFPGITYDEASLAALIDVPSAQLLLDGVAVGAKGRMTDQGFSAAASDVAAGTYAAAVELCGPVRGECVTVDAGEVTVG